MPTPIIFSHSIKIWAKNCKYVGDYHLEKIGLEFIQYQNVKRVVISEVKQ